MAASGRERVRRFGSSLVATGAAGVLLSSSLLFSGGASVALRAPRKRSILVFRSARTLPHCPLCRSKLTKRTPASSATSQPAATIAVPKPEAPASSSTHSTSSPAAEPSAVWVSAHPQRRCSLPTTLSASSPVARRIRTTAGSEAKSRRILIQSPAIKTPPLRSAVQSPHRLPRETPTPEQAERRLRFAGRGWERAP